MPKKDVQETPQITNIVKDLQPLAVNCELIHVDPANPREGHDIEGIAESPEQIRTAQTHHRQ